MAKENGLGGTYSVEDTTPTLQDLSNDVTNATFGTPRTLLDVTGIDVSSMERLTGIADGQVTFNGVFNDAAGQAHPVFKDVATASSNTIRQVTIAHSGQTLTMETLFSDYALTRAADGGLTFSAPGQLAATTSFGWS